ncbi:hypothetical protein HAX54_022630 [Datura stramonium]|uniref:Uncharacterized protein n=1 Tax=Datura stramonium TaxID=4076 RepID=A0ABS8UX29_DATST|nr:hypothetical protein [Datura stramonium]
MMMEATSYETTSGPEESDEEQSAEEDNGDVSKEDAAKKRWVVARQNNVVGHKENVRVGESVEERLEKMEAHSEKVETLLVDIDKKLNYLVKMQDAEVSGDIKRPTKYLLLVDW